MEPLPLQKMLVLDLNSVQWSGLIYKVTPKQHEVIVGSLLGDMSAIKPGPNRNTRLTIGQANLPYLLSLADLLASLIRQQNLTPDNKLDYYASTRTNCYCFP